MTPETEYNSEYFLNLYNSGQRNSILKTGSSVARRH